MSHPLRVALVGFVGEDEVSVNHQVVEVNILRLTCEVIGLAIDTLELTVVYIDVINGISQRISFIAHNHHTILRLLAGDILHRHVANGGVETTAANLFGLIIGIDLEYSFLTLAHGDIAHVDVLNDTTTAGVSLDAEHAVEVRRVHLAVLCKHILATAGNLRADDHAAVTVFHHAVADDDVLRRNTGKAACGTCTSVGITSALDSDTVVACVESTAFDEHILATLGVASVTVRSFVPDLHVAYDNVLREQRMHHPKRRIHHRDTLDEDAVALVEVHQLWAKTLTGTKHALVHVNAVLGIFQQVGTTARILLFLGNLNVTAFRCLSTHQPPGLIRSVTINGTFTGQADVSLLIGIDKRLVVPAVESFPAGRHIRIERTVKGKYQASVFFDDEIHVALHGDGSRVPNTGRNNHLSAASLRTSRNGLVDSRLVLLGRGFCRSTILGDVERAVSELRTADTLFDLLVLSVPG